MGELLLGILAILGECLLEGVGEMILELGMESLLSPFRRAQTTSTLLSMVGILLLGTLAAGGLHLLAPFPLVKPSRWPGLSLILAPLLCGAGMHLYGRWRALLDRPTTRIATFWGGALLAFTFALLRFLLLCHT